MPEYSQSDELYAIAVMAYRIVCGAAYLDLETERSEALRRIVEQTPRSFAVVGGPRWPAGERVLRRALAKDPTRRYPDASRFAAALGRALRSPVQPGSSAARAGRRGQPGRRRSRRRRAVVADRRRPVGGNPSRGCRGRSLVPSTGRGIGGGLRLRGPGRGLVGHGGLDRHPGAGGRFARRRRPPVSWAVPADRSGPRPGGRPTRGRPGRRAAGPRGAERARRPHGQRVGQVGMRRSVAVSLGRTLGLTLGLTPARGQDRGNAARISATRRRSRPPRRRRGPPARRTPIAPSEPPGGCAPRATIVRACPLPCTAPRAGS